MLIKVQVQTRHVSVFLCQSEICCFVRCSECWASFLTSVPSDGIHQQLVLYFLLTNTSISISLILKLVLQGCHPWGCDQLGFYPWVCSQLAFDMLLPSNKSLVTSPGKTEILSIFCVAALRPWSVCGCGLVLWIWLTVNRAESFWKLVLSSALFSVRHIFFLLRAGRVWNGTTALL